MNPSAEAPEAKRTGRALAAVVLIAASTVVTLLALEGGVRRWVANVRPTVMVLDDTIGWKHRPNARRTYTTDGVTAVVETNALGMRGPLYVGPSDRRRVLVLGDSFTDGLEVSNDELFTAVWSGLRPDLEIVNAGVGGYGTVQELQTLERLAPTIQPDRCVVMVYVNDLTDNVMPFYPTTGPRPYVDRDGAPQPLSWEPFAPLLPHLPGAVWLYRHSRFFSLFQMRWLQANLSATQQRYIEGWEQTLPDDDKWRVLEIVARRIAARCPTVLVSLPRREAVAAGDVTFPGRLREVADRMDVEFVDLQGVLRRSDFYDSDIHWRAAGHRAVAQELATRVLPR